MILETKLPEYIDVLFNCRTLVTKDLILGSLKTVAMLSLISPETGENSN